MGTGGDYGVGVKVTCSCQCVIPEFNNGPFDFLGLVNNLAGIAKGGKWPKVAKDIADLVKWMKKTCRASVFLVPLPFP